MSLTHSRKVAAALVGVLALAATLSIGGVVYAKLADNSTCGQASLRLAQTTKDGTEIAVDGISTVSPGRMLKMGYRVPEYRYVAARDIAPAGTKATILFINPATGSPVHEYPAGAAEPADVAGFAGPNDQLLVRARLETGGCDTVDRDLGYLKLFP